MMNGRPASPGPTAGDEPARSGHTAGEERDMSMSCAQCGRSYDSREPVWRCQCGGPLALEPGAPLDPVRLGGRAPTLWRYREVLATAGDPVSLGEPMTPLIAVEHDGRRVELKCDYLLP